MLLNEVSHFIIHCPFYIILRLFSLFHHFLLPSILLLQNTSLVFLPILNSLLSHVNWYDYDLRLFFSILNLSYNLWTQFFNGHHREAILAKDLLRCHGIADST